ncbi:hypothetical protein AAC03nite_29960 [Alicyclobacillus acidoterrestris]|nr:hypothetical protein N007_17655 [Alicyclobacillus acidoterrestris ATCC 49025]GEO27211.1 hypothetical protein AAC03nite_29960 [Alicyclobacillus acidoterrestris]
MIRKVLRPVVVLTVFGLLVGLLNTQSYAEVDGKVVQSASTGAIVGHILMSGFSGLILGFFVELIYRLLRNKN